MITEFTFGSLNLWRKFYLVLSWGMASLFWMFTVWLYVTGEIEASAAGLIYLSAIILLLASWTCYAVARRKLSQLKWLAFLHFIPFGNLIGALIMLSIIRVTKNELTGI